MMIFPFSTAAFELGVHGDTGHPHARPSKALSQGIMVHATANPKDSVCDGVCVCAVAITPSRTHHRTLIIIIIIITGSRQIFTPLLTGVFASL